MNYALLNAYVRVILVIQIKLALVPFLTGTAKVSQATPLVMLASPVRLPCSGTFSPDWNVARTAAPLLRGVVRKGRMYKLFDPGIPFSAWSEPEHVTPDAVLIQTAPFHSSH